MDLRQIDVSLLEAAPRLLAGADSVAGAVDLTILDRAPDAALAALHY